MLLILAVAGAVVILPGGGRPGLDLLRINFSVWYFQAPSFVSRRCGRDLRSPISCIVIRSNPVADNTPNAGCFSTR